MPTYDYTCDACQHGWEEFQPMSAEATKKCPACGKKKARRLIGAGAGLLFKGSGFYITDYRSENYKKGASSDKPSGDSAPKSDSGSSGKSDGGSKSSGGKSGE
ncbi:FmdB family zinc ribbon protein [Planctellipticum variicoloris]|jgi:putative FmdB family regulatory protein|uniref:FmdB family zinc ribbon protein n=1 Tax=Planctellipticum variicoloris TaxID=3064265 RepID=UPI002C29590A|nr:zinc ribbon domain-containing protein [Planctomycetaceae bacterium SH412]HTN04299.1 zinc ribbon domain-containing protein [Planctomycetaceae bacterium]